MRKKIPEFKSPYSEFKRLKFLTNFMAMADMTMEDVATVMGMTRPSVSHWFSVDDVKLSLAMDLIEKKGYKIKISMNRTGYSDEEEMSIEDLIDVTENGIKLKRLSFLTLAVKRYNISRADIAKALDLLECSVTTWFRTDDLPVSRLFEIADKFDLSLTMDISKKHTHKDDNADLPAGNKKKKRTYKILLSTETNMEF